MRGLWQSASATARSEPHRWQLVVAHRAVPISRVVDETPGYNDITSSSSSCRSVSSNRLCFHLRFGVGADIGLWVVVLFVSLRATVHSCDSIRNSTRRDVSRRHAEPDGPVDGSYGLFLQSRTLFGILGGELRRQRCLSLPAVLLPPTVVLLVVVGHVSATRHSQDHPSEGYQVSPSRPPHIHTSRLIRNPSFTGNLIAAGVAGTHIPACQLQRNAELKVYSSGRLRLSPHGPARILPVLETQGKRGHDPVLCESLRRTGLLCRSRLLPLLSVGVSSKLSPSHISEFLLLRFGRRSELQVHAAWIKV